MNSLIVSSVLKRIYTSFDMSTFSNRLRLQKVIYFIQESGINLGYSFSWYLYGPYCPDLTKDAYQIGNFSEVKEIVFENEETEKLFKDFEKKILIHKNDDFWLEIASSIHLLKKVYHPSKTKEKIIEEVIDKKSISRDKYNEISKIWDEMQNEGLI